MSQKQVDPDFTLSSYEDYFTSFEVPFIEEEMTDKQGQELLDYLAVRLPKLLQFAKLLTGQGYLFKMTMTGFAFEFPEDKEVHFDVYEWEKSMGISVCMENSPSRTITEAAEAFREFFDRVWHERRLVQLHEDEPDRKETSIGVACMLSEMMKVEQRLGLETLEVENDFEWGMINGKFSTLRWLFGMEWDTLDT